MKRFAAIFAAFTLAVALMPPVYAQAVGYTLKYHAEDGYIIIDRVINNLPGDTVLTIPDKIDGLPVEKISANACRDEEFDTITLPNTIRWIGDYAFDGCTYLTSLTIPKALENCGNYICNNCPSLKTIVYADGWTHIKSLSLFDGFDGTNDVETVILPDSVQVIEDGAFADWYSLQNVTLPDGLQIIESNDLVCVELSVPSPFRTV